MHPGTVVSAIFSSKRRIVLVGVLLLLVIIGGAFAVGILGVPSIVSIDNTFGPVTDDETTIESALVISNPNPFGIGTDDVTVNYTISMNSIEMAHGVREGVAVGTGNSTLALETHMQNEAIPAWWTSHIENDERTVVDIDATVTSDRLGRSGDIHRSHDIETDLISAFNSDEPRPVNAESPLTNDPVLYINETRGQWGTVTEEHTSIEKEFVVYNPNLEPYAVTEIGYDISMNGVDLGAGETHEGHVIPGQSSETIALTTTINNHRLDEWWVTHLDESIHGHQVSQLRIEFYAVVELPTGNEITIPLDEFTYEETFETDIFDEGGDVGVPTDENGNDAEAEDDEEPAGNDTDEPEEETDEGSNDNDRSDDDTDDDADYPDDDRDDDSDPDPDDDDADDETDDGILPI